MTLILFDGTDSIVRAIVTAPLLYVAVIAFVRISGKRSTSQMNNFDWIVTVAMGSLMASGILLKDVVALDVLVAIGVLVLLQYLVTQGVMRMPWLESIVKPEPRLLVLGGQYLEDAMRAERVTHSEILAAIRANGALDIKTVMAVIFETDASLSVILKTETDIHPADIQKMMAETN